MFKKRQRLTNDVFDICIEIVKDSMNALIP